MLHVALQTPHFCSNRSVGKVIFYRVDVELVIKVHVFSYKAIAILDDTQRRFLAHQSITTLL